MAKLRRAFDAIDSALSLWERLNQIPWLKPAGALLIGLASGAVALVQRMSPIEVFAITWWTIAATIIIFVHGPTLLKRVRQPPFAISIPSMAIQKGKIEGEVQISALIINRSLKNRLVLEFALCTRSKDGKECWFMQPQLRGINPGLGPQEHTEGRINSSIGLVNSDLFVEPDEIHLRVVDRLSTRWARFRIPGSYPPDFFVLR